MSPDTFGPYQLRELIGRGGMGEVHRAYDTRRQRTVALKRLRAEFIADEKFRGRFLKECRRAARLTQAHVIPIHDFGEIDGRLYLDMRLIEGDNLAEAVTAEGHFSPERAVEVVGQIAGALDAAHAAGIVHRDVKPSNVLVESRGPSMHCYLADFGVAGAIGDTGGVSGTATGGMLGTYDYIAPERLLGRPSDHRVDVYALACLLYEVLTGAPPFRRDEVPAMIHAHLNVEPPRASEAVAGIPPMLDAVIARGMAKDPHARYSSAGELAAAARTAVLADRATSPAQPRHTPHPFAPSPRPHDADLNTVPARAPRRPRRRTAGLVVGVVLALAIAGTSTAATWYFLRPVVQLEGANAVGAEPPFITPEDLNAPAAPPSTQKVVPAAVSVVSGDTPGLYGGTKTDECNAAAIERFLVAHPDRGQAWARAQGIDPGDIHRVLTSLTPVTLRTDTAVTNHGFKNGGSTQFQSVLQAGTAVLVDVRGVPRVRCYCGNPLLRPEQPQSVRYEGPTWTDFSKRSVTVIKKAPAPVVDFVVVERDTQKVVSRPRATNGDKDRDADPVITEKVKDRPIGEGTASRSEASTDGDHGAKDSNEDASADSPVQPGVGPDGSADERSNAMRKATTEGGVGGAPGTEDDHDGKKDAAGDTADEKDATDDTPDKKNVTDDNPDKKNLTDGTPDKKNLTDGTPDKKNVADGTPDKKNVADGTLNKKYTGGTPGKKDDNAQLKDDNAKPKRDHARTRSGTAGAKSDTAGAKGGTDTIKGGTAGATGGPVGANGGTTGANGGTTGANGGAVGPVTGGTAGTQSGTGGTAGGAAEGTSPGKADDSGKGGGSESQESHSGGGGDSAGDGGGSDGGGGGRSDSGGGNSGGDG
jgi:tRNA A-37 threonylcarbamoyl transferase component Bud32